MDELIIRSLHLTSEHDALEVLQQAKVDPCVIQSILPKMFHLNIVLKDLDCKVANMIRQEMLALGGDAAVAQGTILSSIAMTDVILIGTLLQLRQLSEKISPEHSGMGDFSEKMRTILENVFADSFMLRTSKREIALGQRTLIMGILNVTPDSFSDGGRFESADKAVEEGIKMIEEGADILDIGGESTRPGSDGVSLDEELRRVIPVIRALAERTDIPLSVDTMKSPVARQAVAVGAEIINDVSSMQFDMSMAKVVSDSGAAVVLMHMKGMPKSMQTGDLTYESLRGEILDYLRRRIDFAKDEGIDPARIMIDPGIGFGKTAVDNMRLIKYLNEFRSLGRPILVGASRKAFIGQVTGGKPAERCEGTAAVVAAAILNGTHVIRVHDVAMMKKVAAMTDAVMRA